MKKIVIEIIREDYEKMLSRVDEKSPLYLVLKNFMIVHSAENGRPPDTRLTICDEDQAEALLRIAKQCCPDATSRIGRAIDLSRAQ